MGNPIFDSLVQAVKRLEPGQHIVISHDVLGRLAVMRYKGFLWTPADRILENIIGSAYEFCYRERFPERSIEFWRLEKPVTGDNGVKAYVSPDRRDHWVKDPIDGLYYWRD